MQIYFLSQGQLRKLALRLTAPQQPPKRGEGKRGKVVGFSQDSRRRLLHLFSRLNTPGTRCTFVTLTFHHEQNAARAKAKFRRLLERFRRAYPRLSLIWRIERQARGDIHFHLICFNLPYLPQATLQRIWQECTDEPLSIVHIKLLKSRRHAFYYVSKYVAKNGDKEAAGTSLDIGPYLHGSEDGRQWGIFRRECLPWAQLRVWSCTSEHAAAYERRNAMLAVGVPYYANKMSNFTWMQFGGGGWSSILQGHLELVSEMAGERLARAYGWTVSARI